ncbi:MAG: nucleotide exchange factor GrpE [Acidobacteriota bacterium]|nr:nucleotide exchange factor GrpE [Acidobacteriota bacterium]
MNEQDFNSEEFLEEETAETTANGERRFDEEIKKTKVEVKDEKTGKSKPAEIINLEKQLNEARARYEAAETKLVDVQKRFDQAKNNLEKETAEMRQRLLKTLEDRAKQGQFNFLTTLLPVLDNLNLAITASEQDSSFEHLLSGVKGTARSFEQALMSVGVEPIQAIGADFNPELHEAVDMVAAEPENDDKITAEYARGYKFGEKLLRPAKVQVGKAMAQSVGE